MHAAGGDAIALEGAFLDEHLTLATGRVLGANRFDVDAQRARRGPHVDAMRYQAAPARWLEDDGMLLGHAPTVWLSFSLSASALRKYLIYRIEKPSRPRSRSEARTVEPSLIGSVIEQVAPAWMPSARKA